MPTINGVVSRAEAAMDAHICSNNIYGATWLVQYANAINAISWQSKNLRVAEPARGSPDAEFPLKRVRGSFIPPWVQMPRCNHEGLVTAVIEGFDCCVVGAMIALPAGVRMWLAAGATDVRKGFDGLAALVQMQLAEDPFSGQLSYSADVQEIG